VNTPGGVSSSGRRPRKWRFGSRSIPFIAVRHLCDRVIVMYLGRIMEEGPAAELFRAPAHPYTRALLAATPSIRHRGAAAAPVAGEAPSIANPPSGCGFRTRCPFAKPACAETVPPLTAMPDAPARRLACLRADEIA
jgi:oligopeptide/dipeptide ABC transporter ATP-binding protein